MKFKFKIAAALLAGVIAAAAHAQFPNQHPDGTPMPSVSQSTTQQNLPGTIKIGEPMPGTQTGMNAPVVVVPPPIAEAKTTVALGDYAGAITMWMLPILLPMLAAFATDLFVKLRTRLGLQTSDAQRTQFQQIVENGVALGAHEARASLSGKLTFDVKNQIMASAVDYAKNHGVDTLKAIGVDPESPEAEQAIRARAAKMLADLDAAATAVMAGVPATPPSPLSPDTAAVKAS
jgi:hypothetical protein